MDPGKIGIWTGYRPFGIERAGEAAKLAEQLGYSAWWVGGSPHVPEVRPILEATSTLVAATGILNVWINDPSETAAADAALRADFPGRFMLGIGIGHPEATSDYRRPLTTMRAFLDGLDATPTRPPVAERCLAALGPKMLAVAREYAKLYLGLRNYTQNLLDFGFADGDLADGGSDRLIDAVIPQGRAEQ